MINKPEKIILVWLVSFFISINVYAGDERYKQGTNYSDPNKPNYMRGTRTDMAPKVDYGQDDKKKSSGNQICKPSEGVIRAYDSRYSRNSIDGVLHPVEVVSATKLWEKECEAQKKEAEKMPSQPILRSSE